MTWLDHNAHSPLNARSTAGELVQQKTHQLPQDVFHLLVCQIDARQLRNFLRCESLLVIQPEDITFLLRCSLLKVLTQLFEQNFSIRSRRTTNGVDEF